MLIFLENSWISVRWSDARRIVQSTADSFERFDPSSWCLAMRVRSVERQVTKIAVTHCQEIGLARKHFSPGVDGMSKSGAGQEQAY
jgi:hypothetical protein